MLPNGPDASRRHSALAVNHRFESLLIEDATESYFPELKAAAIEMIVAQGGIVGWLTPLSALAAAATVEMVDV